MQVERNDGTLEMPHPWSNNAMREALSRKDVKEVHVFNIELGLELTIKGKQYRVSKINKKGKKVIVHMEKV